VDGIQAETVESIRVHSNLPTILDNIDMLMGLRGAKAKPGIVIRYALMKRNIDELPAALEYWAERGVTRLDAGYLVLANGIPREESLFFHQDHMQRVFEAARRISERYPKTLLNLPPTIEEEKKRQQQPKNCRAPWDFVMIDTSGHVLPCYRAFEALQMGKILGEGAIPFDDIWNGPDYQNLRRTVNQSGARAEGGYGYCKVCENRFGWSSLDVHLGDETWIKRAIQNPDSRSRIDHKRKGFRPLVPNDSAPRTPEA